MAGFKRAISSRIVEQSRFLKLTPTQQILYMQLCLHADDEGVAEGRMSCLLCGADDEELQALENANLIKILNDDPVIYIADWDEHNTIRSDRIIKSVYHDLLVKVTGKTESECDSSDNMTQYADKVTRQDDSDEKTESSDKSLSDKELTETVGNACQFDKDLTRSDNICQQNDKTCQNSDTICQSNTIQYNTSNISQEKKKNIQKEKREVPINIKSCNNSLSRHFGHSNVEIAGLLLEWMRDKDSGTLDSWVKRLKDLSSGKLGIATEIIGKSVRCKYKDFYPVQENSPGIAFQNPNNSIVKDRTDQYKNVQDDSISL